MIFTKSGKTYGLLSARCIEEDIRIRIDEVFESGKPQIFTYNQMADGDLLWGMGSGCNGKVEIFVEPLSKSDRFVEFRFCLNTWSSENRL